MATVPKEIKFKRDNRRDDIAPCPTCDRLPDLMQYPFNKQWKVICFKCHSMGDPQKTKKLAIETWNDLVKMYAGELPESE